MTQPVSSRLPVVLRRWWIGVLAYVVVGIVWIVASDLLLFGLQEEPRWWSVAKGSAYVLVTAAVVALVLTRVRRNLDRTLRELSAREAELALLGANAKDLLYHLQLEPEPRFVFVSDAAERLVGYTPQDHYDDPGLGDRLVHPDDRHLLQDPDALSGTLRCRWLHRDGRVVWCEQQNQVQVEGGQLVGVIGVARDVTAEVLRAGVSEVLDQVSRKVLVEEQGLESALQRAASSLRPLFEAVEVAVEVGESAGAICRGHAVEAVAPTDGDPLAAGGRVDLEANVGATSIRVVATRSSPDPQVLRELLPIMAERVDAIHGAELRDLQLRQLQQALESSASAVLVTDREGSIEWVNRAFTRITGYAEDEVLGQTPRLLKSGVHDAALYDQLWGTISAGSSFAQRLIDRRKDGSTYTAAVTIDPVRDREGRIQGFVGVQKDITLEEQERGRVHRRELEALEREREIERDRSLLVQTISHELRTPLTLVLGVAETLTRPDLESSQRDELLQALARARQQVLGRLDVLLAATDGIEGPAEQVPVAALVRAALAGLWREHDTSRVVVEGDAVWTGQRALAKALLAPLLDNALEHAPRGTPVQVTVRSGSDGVVISIRDEGPGIPRHVLDRLDQPFQQGDAGSTREHPGFGLGLYAARRVVQRLAGSLRFATDPAGTEVHIHLPDDPGTAS